MNEAARERLDRSANVPRKLYQKSLSHAADWIYCKRVNQRIPVCNIMDCANYPCKTKEVL